MAKKLSTYLSIEYFFRVETEINGAGLQSQAVEEGNNQEDEQELDVDNPDAMPIEDTVEMRQCGSCFYYFTSKGGQYLNLVI